MRIQNYKKVQKLALFRARWNMFTIIFIKMSKCQNELSLFKLHTVFIRWPLYKHSWMVHILAQSGLLKGCCPVDESYLFWELRGSYFGRASCTVLLSRGSRSTYGYLSSFGFWLIYSVSYSVESWTKRVPFSMPIKALISRAVLMRTTMRS